MKEQESGSEPATVLDLPRLVDYQGGAVVSRTLIKEKGGTVSVFAFDAGQELSEHTAPHEALVQLLDGEAEFSVEGKAYKLQAGQSLILPAHRPHAVKATHRFKMVLTMIRS